MRYPAVLLAVLFVFSFTAAVSAQDRTRLDDVDALRDEGQFELALDRLEEMNTETSDSAPILWRLAWTRVDLGEAETGERRQDLFRDALQEARRAVELDPDDARAHMVRAIAAGRVALDAGTREKIELSREVKESADEAIRLDETLDGAYHVRGRWNHEIASLGFVSRSIIRVVYGGLPDASYEAAVRDLSRAAELRDRVIHRMELGRSYHAMGDRSRAREQLQRAIQMPDDGVDAPRYREEARELLSRL